MNNKRKRAVLFLVLFGIVVGGLFFVGKKSFERQNDETVSVEFEISKGENILTIAENLKKEK
ncbi:MAG TPA: hypothetical protein ENJ49_00020, partial [Candidatus Moranbacteria bacterium]|nr:hypothetical protein [Candidatus Moranbacteria bacterium]